MSTPDVECDEFHNLDFFEGGSFSEDSLRTSNIAERVNAEIRRRTKVVRIFPNPESCERLVTAILMEISEEWIAGKIYLNVI
ncbi:MAG: hypothetical protein A3I77_03530 [Gammaproteobacteria bacterium RIFCSPLOWO2_02_FULL_42_14]|nr:MAG: hypothetical protein A3B71_04835 [Gammaproteobacteria bacterium RIFCSPHIGHO2_02_FULL_42_43]OGT29109.1 MAG: hypothetical protein A2624_06455 [Gammaproteobacteria bacterium RIFCSPHIGHO2_01_FULL_42_8]OGT51329.1 MAG: hypothetical protein A3E54_04600 [Gammaproteobacteria bacterium RIFCSPHIGHO2_12_FULL_41_25]OGT62031.1 MAG: hypothetical protein A3I77_03530 [Gammaproteobacteria bacterium RIFCSPLOWO2_02_FULL_42_14]OGT85704.1 MAG: hypothetical protein A3G86_03225 [Gammaproteobacteria bacterium R